MCFPTIKVFMNWWVIRRYLGLGNVKRKKKILCLCCSNLYPGKGSAENFPSYWVKQNSLSYSWGCSGWWFALLLLHFNWKAKLPLLRFAKAYFSQTQGSFPSFRFLFGCSFYYLTLIFPGYVAVLFSWRQGGSLWLIWLFHFKNILTMHHLGAFTAHSKEVSVVAENIEWTYYKT